MIERDMGSAVPLRCSPAPPLIVVRDEGRGDMRGVEALTLASRMMGAQG
ncbi:hypothetical protein [Methylobacterium longum]|uniref:Uncharacterized protein n=1 Tax=Methylobacterium longum TaxID=767694 RepID=A0ABT8AVG7_9HYPH|nr:hypothetical protein [Methylobacterium longum]MDN3573932.1 hypothetical protein [Methylobacterium longum]